MKRRGAVMVLTLLVLTGLVAILAAVTATQRMAFKAETNRLATRRTAVTADAACQYVAATLSQQSKTATNLQDDWASLGTAGDERFTYGAQSFRIQVIDTASRINLNNVSQTQMTQMNFTQDQIDSLLDWRAAGQTPRANGAKDSYYDALPIPYNTALRSFHSVDELLLVKGFTAADLFKEIAQQEGAAGNNVTSTSSPSTSTTDANGNTVPVPVLYDLLTVDSVSQDVGANGQAKMGVNSAAATVQSLARLGLPVNIAAAIVQRRVTGRPFTSIGQVLALPGVNARTAASIIDNLSITGNARVTGKLNLNTVTEDVLNTIPNITPDQVRTIIQQQQTGFTSLGQLATLSGITTRDLQNLVDYFTVNSETFTVRIEAEAGDIKKAYEATISIEGNTPRVIRMMEAPGDAETRWGWTDTASSDTAIEGTTATQ